MSPVKEFLLKIVRTKTGKAVVGLLAAALSAYAASGCGVFGAKHPAEFDVFACQIDAIADFVPEAAAEDIAMAARAGNYDYVVRQLLRLGLDEKAVMAAAEAFQACSPPAPPQAPQAPSPASLLRT